MRRIVITLVCLACTGHGRQGHVTSHIAPGSLHEEPENLLQAIAGWKQRQSGRFAILEQLKAVSKLFLAFNSPTTDLHFSGHTRNTAVKNPRGTVQTMITDSNNLMLRSAASLPIGHRWARSTMPGMSESKRTEEGQIIDVDVEDEDLEDEDYEEEDEDEYEIEERKLSPEQKEALMLREANIWIKTVCAVALSEGTGLQPFSTPVGWHNTWGMTARERPPEQAFTDQELTAEITRCKPRFEALLNKCLDCAPTLCNPSSQGILPLARLAAWSGEWIRPLDEWSGEAGLNLSSAVKTAEKVVLLFRSLSSHLLEKYDVPEGLHGALAYQDGPPVSEACQRIAKSFLEVHTAAAQGGSVPNTLKSAVSPMASKAVAKEFAKFKWEDVGANQSGSPLHAFRRAQVASLGGEKWVADAVCESRLGDELFLATTEPALDEEFAFSTMEWAVNNQDKLEGPLILRSTIDFFFEMKSIDPDYKVAGRSPKKIEKALEAFTASTVDTTSDEYDEPFQRNPRGIRPLFEMNASIPEGTRIDVPYDRADYTFPAPGHPGSITQPGNMPGVVRITEILSLRRLMYEGEMLTNCLEGNLNSVMKYLSRARSRTSSFWSLTKQEEGGEVQYLGLIEVWHLRHGNDIRQAEGPRPRTIPGPEAWYWMDHWCKREGIDLSTWDCYSR